jgi:hypothetical protein
VHGLGAPLRQFVRFARPWERVLLGIVLFVGGALLQSYVIAALGVVIVGVTIMGVLRRRREAMAGTGVSEKETGSEVGEP